MNFGHLQFGLALLIVSTFAFSQNNLPDGYHDAQSGVQEASGCIAAGWAADPDSLSVDLPVRVLSDGLLVAETSAGLFRQDLLDAGVCLDGTCSFEVNLFGRIPNGVDHQITAQAQDAQTGEWINLNATPKTLQCLGTPEGTHDGRQDGQHNFGCIAEGWAANPENRDLDLKVRVLSDDVVVARTTANMFRADLEAAGVCPGGTCGFSVLLWGHIKPGVEHSITVQAQDPETRVWTNLSQTPRRLRCYRFNLTTHDFATGRTKLISDMPNFGQFNPRWSPNGKKIANIVVGWKKFPTDFLCGTHITDVSTGTTTPLEGADGGATAVFSPNGNRILFDRSCGGDPSLYLVRAGGGKRRLVRTDAVEADWSPDGRRVVFHQPSDGSLHTRDLDEGTETFLGFGISPAWSPDGHWIAYNTDDTGDIWKIEVDRSGNPVGSPIQLTTDPLFEKKATWSGDSKTIYFASEHDGHTDPLDEEFDIWSISASGGELRKLTPDTGMGVDLAFWKKGGKIAYGGYQLPQKESSTE